MLENVKLNDSGTIVKIAQYLTRYVDRKKATGTYTSYFVNYICSWQKNRNIPETGEVDETTWRKLAEDLPTCSTKKNTKSSYVCGLQLLIGGLTVDGVYGNNTKKAVAAYQSSRGLTADGICGPKTWNALIIGDSITQTNKVLNDCVKYLQWDSKWKNIKYSTHTSSQTIGNSGCGPTSMAMIMATFIDKKITPVEMCELAVDNGYRTYNNGTAWGFYDYIFKKYDGFSKYIKTTSVSTLKAALREGALAVCSMNANDGGFWTKSGCDKNGPFLVNLEI